MNTDFFQGQIGAYSIDCTNKKEKKMTLLITAHFEAIECFEDIIAFLSFCKIVLLLLVVVTDLKEQRLES